MARLEDADVLALWDRRQTATPAARGLALLAAACPELSDDMLLDLPLDERDRSILALREATFGRALPGWTSCPACSERLTFELDSRDHAAQLAPSFQTGPLRAPTSRDLAALAAARDAEEAERLLVERLGGGHGLVDDHADAGLRFTCAACGAGWTEDFDIGSYFWEEIDQHARRLLDDVDTLACAYGWREHEILALSPARRAAYLERRLA